MNKCHPDIVYTMEYETCGKIFNDKHRVHFFNESCMPQSRFNDKNVIINKMLTC